MNKIIKSGVTALATTAMLTGMAFLMPAVAHAEDGAAPATPAVKSIACPAAPTLTATGSLPQGGEGYDWVRVAGRVFAVAKAGYASLKDLHNVLIILLLWSFQRSQSSLHPRLQ